MSRTACIDPTQVFCDDGNYTGWTAITQSTPAGAWSIATDTGPLGWSSKVPQQTEYSGINYIYLYAWGASFGPWANQTVTASIKPVAFLSTSSKFGVCVRYTGTVNDDAAGYCLMWLNEATPALEIVKKVSGNSTPNRLLKQSGGSIPAAATGIWKKLKFVASGSSTVTLTGYIDDVQLIQTTDSSSPIASGYPGVVSRGAQFNTDELSLTSP